MARKKYTVLETIEFPGPDGIQVRLNRGDVTDALSAADAESLEARGAIEHYDRKSHDRDLRVTEKGNLSDAGNP